MAELLPELPELTEEERRYLGMHALYAAHRALDVRTFDAPPVAERVARAKRWKEIADALHPEVFDTPNRVAELEWHEED